MLLILLTPHWTDVLKSLHLYVAKVHGSASDQMIIDFAKRQKIHFNYLIFRETLSSIIVALYGGYCKPASVPCRLAVG